MRASPFLPEAARGRRIVCSVADGKYLIPALVALQSAVQLTPDTVAVLLVSDDSNLDGLTLDFPLYLVRLDDVMEPNMQRELSLVYTPFEFSTGLKSLLLGYLLRTGGAAKVLFVDADTLTSGSLDPVFDALETSSIVLFPHHRTPRVDRVGAKRDKELLGYGVFNAGVVGLRHDANALEFTEWWASRNRYWGRARPDLHEYADQRWFDFAPALFSGVNARGVPGMNIGHWNLFELGRVGPAGTSHFGSPPVLLHFSGVSLSEDDPLFRWPQSGSENAVRWWTQQAEAYRMMIHEARAAWSTLQLAPGYHSAWLNLSQPTKQYLFEVRLLDGIMPTSDSAINKGSVHYHFKLHLYELRRTSRAVLSYLIKVVRDLASVFIDRT